jgi:hypothetical protein
MYTSENFIKQGTALMRQCVICFLFLVLVFACTLHSVCSFSVSLIFFVFFVCVCVRACACVRVCVV